MGESQKDGGPGMIRLRFSEISKFEVAKKLFNLNRRGRYQRIADVEEVDADNELLAILYDGVDRAVIVGMIGNMKNLSVQ